MINFEKYRLLNLKVITGGTDTTDPDDPIDKNKLKPPGSHGQN